MGAYDKDHTGIETNAHDPASCDDHDCEENRLITRRALFQGGAGAMAFAAMGMPGLSLAALPTDRRFVFVLLRGGLDGLAAVPAYADPAYKGIRGQLAVAEPGKDDGALDLNGFFGLHPSLKNLHGLYQQGDLSVFHAVATPYRERSHFDAQNLLEVGADRPNGASDGWMNRMLGLYGAEGARLGIAFNQTIPLILSGSTPVSSWAPGGADMPDDFLARLAHVYAHDQLFSTLLQQAVSADVIADQAQQGMMGGGGAAGGNQVLTRTLGTAARMLQAADGPRMAVIEVGGWDTHANQGAGTGQLANRLRQLDEGIALLAKELAPVWDRTAIVVMTEFGRTVAVNGTRGTDHGTGGMALLAGGSVNGGHVLTNWPGLDTSKLYQGRDLAPTLDARSILKSVLAQHLGLSWADVENHVFPNSREAGPIRQLIKT